MQPTVLTLQHDSGSVDSGLSSSRLDESFEDSARAEDSEPKELEDSRDAEGLEEIQELEGAQESDEIEDDVRELEGEDHSKEQESWNPPHLRSWEIGHITAKITDQASPSSASANRLDQRSVFTEPSYSRGSFLQPVKGSFLHAVDSDFLCQRPSSPSPSHSGSNSDLAPTFFT